jgi:hypothetical protein
MIILTANCVRHSGQEDHQTGVLTQELIDGYGLLPQQILCEAIADYDAKIKSQEKEQPGLFYYSFPKELRDIIKESMY